MSATFAPLPLPQALERLSVATGMRLTCASAFRDEPLFVRLKDADEDRVLQEIASLYDARWERRGDGQILLPDPVAARRAMATDAAVTKTLEGSLAYLKRRLVEQPATLTNADAAANGRKRKAEEASRALAEERKDYARMFTASTAAEETPGWRAAARLVPLLGESTLLALPNDSRTVWSDAPTPVQRALPASADAVLRAYRGELGVFKPDAEPVRVRLVAKRWEEGGAFNVTFQAVDRAGKLVDSAFLRMNDDMDRMRGRSPVFDPPAPVAGERPLALTDEIREYDAVMNIRETSPARSAARAALLPRWTPILADPVAYEPTRWLPVAEILLAANALGKNLVGRPSEITGARFERDRTGETPTQLVRRMSGLVERDGWLVEDPERQPASSREEAKRFIREAVARGGVSVDSAAAWVAATDGPFGVLDWVGDHIGAVLGGEGPYGADGNLLNGNGLRLWAALGARDALRRGDRLDLNGLPAAAQRRIERIAYWFGGVEGGEPTEILPNGIEGGTVSLTVAETPIAVLASNKQARGGPSMPVSAEMLGGFLAKGDRYREVDAEAYRAYDRYRMGVSRAYTLHFRLGREAVPMDVELDETFLDPKAPTLDALPEAFAKAVEAARLKAAATPDPIAKPAPTGKP